MSERIVKVLKWKFKRCTLLCLKKEVYSAATDWHTEGTKILVHIQNDTFSTCACCTLLITNASSTKTFQKDSLTPENHFEHFDSSISSIYQVLRKQYHNVWSYSYLFLANFVAISLKIVQNDSNCALQAFFRKLRFLACRLIAWSCQSAQNDSVVSKSLSKRFWWRKRL